jgi:hypothetical protein
MVDETDLRPDGMPRELHRRTMCNADRPDRRVP